MCPHTFKQVAIVVDNYRKSQGLTLALVVMKHVQRRDIFSSATHFHLHPLTPDSIDERHRLLSKWFKLCQVLIGRVFTHCGVG